MQRRDIRTICIFSAGAVITASATMLSWANLGNFMKEANIPFFSLFVSLMSAFVTTVLLMYDRFASFEEEMRVQSDIAYRGIDDRIRQQRIGAFTIFDNTTDALRYEFHLLENAKSVWNTRFTDTDRGDLLSIRARFTNTQDDLVAQALVDNGCHYELIVSSDQPNEVGRFRDLAITQLPKYGSKISQAIGEYTAWTLDMKAGLPLLQMFIVELEDGSREALIGWLHSDKRILRPCVIAFRDPKVVDFYLSVFDIYKDNADRFDMSQLMPAAP